VKEEIRRTKQKKTGCKKRAKRNCKTRDTERKTVRKTKRDKDNRRHMIEASIKE
jgi:hypothetical protein